LNEANDREADMNEAEWLATTDIIGLLSHAYADQRSIRKWRMFSIACCHAAWPHLSEWARRSLAVLEDVAGGQLPDIARAERSRAAPQPQSYADRAVWKAIRAGKEARAYARYDIPRHVLSAAGPHDGDPSRERVRQILADAARDIFGNPWRPPPPTFDPAWRAWNDSAPLKLAQGIDEDRLCDRLPVLADALEEAGCADTDLLSHLRSGGPHFRGCWALDLVLGKQ
jgi:hypothetical protein